MSLDLNKNNLADAAEAGYEFEIVLPGSGDKTGAFVTVRGEMSKHVKAFARSKFREFQIREQQAKRRGKESDLSIEEAEDLAVETAVARVISWRGITEDGVDVPFNQENAERVFREHSWIREQVMEESGQLLNFRC